LQHFLATGFAIAPNHQKWESLLTAEAAKAATVLEAVWSGLIWMMTIVSLVALQQWVCLVPV
jgi:hypothetical protein